MNFASFYFMLTTLLFYAGLGYATVFTLCATRNENTEKKHEKEKTEMEENDMDDKKKEQNKNNTCGVELPLSSLKLWIILTFLSSLSYLGVDNFPLFLELRVIFTWFVLFLPPTSHVILYDSVFCPFFDYVEKSIDAFKNNKAFVRGVGLAVLRGCVEFGVFFTNFIWRRGLLDDDVAHDISGGLLFTRKTLEKINKAEFCRGKELSSSCSDVKLTL